MEMTQCRLRRPNRCARRPGLEINIRFHLHLLTMPKHCSAVNCKNRDVGDMREQNISFHQ